jgi:hypothetical protein
MIQDYLLRAQLNDILQSRASVVEPVPPLFIAPLALLPAGKLSLSAADHLDGGVAKPVHQVLQDGFLRVYGIGYLLVGRLKNRSFLYK